MSRNYRTIRIFAEEELQNYLKARKKMVISSIESEKDDYLLNVNDFDYVRYKAEEAKVEPLEIHFDQIYVSSSEKMIPAKYFPSTFFVEDGESYKKDVIKFHVPISGNQDLITCAPSRRILCSLPIELDRDEFTFEIINFSDDVESINSIKNENIQHIRSQLSNVTSEVTEYNNAIESHIKNAFDVRKRKLLSKNNLLASLGVPIKKASGVSPTFSVPHPEIRKKISVAKPVVFEAGFTPEPSLDIQAYNQILQLIHDVGKGFERLPSVYADKEEEHLRDHFLMMLELNFEGSATGETFNKKGKTDILLRHENSNVFITECKFWKGKKAFLDTITQLLGYLTWRDSKASVIIFVSNKDFSSVLETAKQAIPEHENYIDFLNIQDETWINYQFHLNNDRNRLVNLAVMFYHLPR